MVSPPKNRISNADSHSIGETLPSFTFDTITAMSMAAMNAAVLNVIAVIGLFAPQIHPAPL